MFNIPACFGLIRHLLGSQLRETEHFYLHHHLQSTSLQTYLSYIMARVWAFWVAPTHHKFVGWWRGWVLQVPRLTKFGERCDNLHLATLSPPMQFINSINIRNATQPTYVLRSAYQPTFSECLCETGGGTGEKGTGISGQALRAPRC